MISVSAAGVTKMRIGMSPPIISMPPETCGDPSVTIKYGYAA
jgi:hypothetical protein